MTVTKQNFAFDSYFEWDTSDS